jgi:hypothetical protein
MLETGTGRSRHQIVADFRDSPVFYPDVGSAKLIVYQKGSLPYQHGLSAFCEPFGRPFSKPFGEPFGEPFDELPCEPLRGPFSELFVKAFQTFSGVKGRWKRRMPMAS